MEEISPTKQNILEYLDYKGISKADFCRQTGFSYENFKGKSLKSDIGGAVLGKIITIYSDLSPYWLLTGEGSMLKGGSTSDNASEIPINVIIDSPLVKQLLTVIDTQAREIDQLKIELANERASVAANQMSTLSGES